MSEPTTRVMALLKWDDELREQVAVLASHPQGSGRFVKARILVLDKYPDTVMIGVNWSWILHNIRGTYDH
jgi:hypothetical protein